MAETPRRRWQLWAPAAAVLLATVGWWAVRRAPVPDGAPAGLPTAEELDRGSRFLVPVVEPPPRAGEPGVRLAGLRDPFQATPSPVPPAASGAAGAVGERWRVSAVLVGERRRMAVVNDRLVGPGDLLPGRVRVVAVERGRVVLQTPDGSRTILKLQGGDGS